MVDAVTEPQWPVAGKFNKDFKVTDPFGYRMHPIRHERIHHNGVDFWGAKEPLKLEVWFDGVVIVKATNMASFGNYVVIRSNVFGKTVTTLYAHMKEPSKLRKGQKVTAGTVVGIMGATGPVTGKHLHLEIGKGRTHPFIFGGDGKRYYDPIKFIRATIKKWEAEQELADAHTEAGLATPTDSVDDVAIEENVTAETAPIETVAEKVKKPSVKK